MFQVNNKDNINFALLSLLLTQILCLTAEKTACTLKHTQSLTEQAVYRTWSCVAFFIAFPIDFHRQMTTLLVYPENDLIQKFIQGLHGFILN